MSELGDKIIALREQGYSYNRIVEELGCSKGTVAYHLGAGQKEKTAERQKLNRFTAQGGLTKAIHHFSRDQKVSTRNRMESGTRSATRRQSDHVGEFQAERSGKRRVRQERSFEWTDVLDKFGQSTVCYLSGDPIDLSDPYSYSFDHIVPVVRGGSNELDNLGLTTRQVNYAKGAMSVDEFVEMCVKVARNFGYIQD